MSTWDPSRGCGDADGSPDQGFDWRSAALVYGRERISKPDDFRLCANQGNAFWLADEPWQALSAYQDAAQLNPASAVVFRGLGNAYVDLQQFEAAERSYRLSLRLEPDPATAWNLSQLLIGLERYADGYALAEERWAWSEVPRYRNPLTAWNGALDGTGPLLVWSEQGLGDTLQHLRWLGSLVVTLRDSATPLVLEVEACLIRLFQEGLAHLDHPLDVRAKASESMLLDPDEWAGRHVSLLSLPHLLEPRPQPRHGCWLRSQRWNHQPVAAAQNRRVGLVWAAGRKLQDPVTAREYWRRSLDEASLARLIEGLHTLGGQWMFLQFADDRDQVKPWIQPGDGLLDPNADFQATADVVSGLDLVISVDTAMAHLLGAMGHEGWVLLPFSAAPRWLRGCDDTPWYPSLRLFRQPHVGDWSSVVEAVLEELAHRFSR
jgi:tetratricopeptide (TPR) repeat protein